MLDVTTELVLWAAAATTVSLVLLRVWTRDRQMLPVLWWAMGFILSAAGTVLVAVRGQVPDLLSIAGAGTLLLAGQSAWLAGVTLLRRRRLHPVLLLPPLAWVLAVPALGLQQDPSLRLACFALISAFSYGWLFVMLGLRMTASSAARRALAGICLFEALRHLAMAALVVHAQRFNLLESPGVAFSLLLSLVVLIMAVVYGGRLITERSEEKLRVLARTDMLTRVLNRHGLHERLDELTLGQGAPLIGLVLFDLDGFKTVNDRLGHVAGDQVLVHFARLAESYLRPGDALGRLGGDEFVALLPVHRESEAAALADLVRAGFVACPQTLGGSVVEVTASIGVAVLPAAESKFAELLAAADRALYLAKAGGRNQTRMAEVANAPLRPVLLRREA